MNRHILIIISTFYFFSCANNSVENHKILKKANYLCSLVNDNLQLNYGENFELNFQKSLPEKNLASLFKNIAKDHGDCQKVSSISNDNPYSIQLITNKNRKLNFNLSLNKESKLISGLWFLGVDGLDFNKYSDQICKLISKSPNFKYEDYFHKSFINAVSYDQIVSVFSSIYEEYGPCLSKKNKSKDGLSGYILTGHKDDTELKFSMTLSDEEGKLKIAGLLYTGKVTPKIKLSSHEEVIKTLKNFEQNVDTFSFYFAPLNPTNNSHIKFNEEKRHALGSVFKLYILATLSKQIKEGKLSWDKVYKIKEEFKSLPSGKMQNLEVGIPVSLKKFASEMISISDNTATDHLLKIVTAKAVENFIKQEKLNDFPNDNSPFLSTLDMFKTRAFFTQKQANIYPTLDRIKKQSMIDDLPYKNRHDLLDKISTWKEPKYIDKIEWFATPKNICSLYAWMENNGDKELRNILSINTPFIKIENSKRWSYAGYKGGSEPGVLEMSYLLEDKKGEKFCLYIGSNNSKQPINEDEFFSLVEGIFDFLDK